MEAQNLEDSRLFRPALTVLVVLGALGILFFFAKFDESFPSASIDLRFTRTQIAQQAQQWAEKLGYSPKQAITSTVFTYDQEAKTFLEYELGQARANELMRDAVPVWMWQTRYCRPSQIEELNLCLAPDGKLVSVSRTIPNEQELPSLKHEAALEMAKQFIETTLGHSLKDCKLIKDSEKRQAHRTDFYFNWEDEQHDYKGAHLRYYLYLSGNIITSYSYYLHVPEQFQRKYAEIRSYNTLLKTASSVIYIILSSAVSFIFIWAFMSGRIRWKLAFAAGAIAAILSVIGFFDDWPSLIADYKTTVALDQYITQSLIAMAVSALYTGFATTMFFGALEPVYRIMFPKKVAMQHLFTSKGLRSLPVIRALIAGLAVFGIHTAYVVAFYLAGNKFGFWSPLEVRNFNTVSGVWPVFGAINVGVTASTTEELLYRVLALFVFQRITGRFWLANVLQAASWAFMHSDYPQEPAYARGVELTIGGAFYGYVLKRFGLLACVLAHYTYDAFLGVTPLLVSPVLSVRLMSLIALLPGPLALLISAVQVRMKGVFTDLPSISNEEPVEKPAAVVSESEASPPVAYEPVERKWLVGVVIAAMVALLIVVALPKKTVGRHEKMRISCSQAIAIARAYLHDEKLSVSDKQVHAYLSEEDDDTQLQYVLEQEKYAKTKELSQYLSPKLSWKVWFFKELDPEQFFVAVGPDGRVLGQWIVEDENAVGGKLSAEEARNRAEQFLTEAHPALAPIAFDDATKHEEKNRTDYDLAFKVPKLKVGEAEFKINTGTVGKFVSGYSRSWDIPDKWLYEREKVTLKDNIVTYLHWIYYGVITVLGFIWFVFTLRSGKIEWRWPIALGLIDLLLTLISNMNWLPSLFSNYSPEVKISTFILNYLSESATSMLSSAAGMALLGAVAVAAFGQVFPGQSIRTMLQPFLAGAAGNPQGRRRMWLDGVVLGYTIALILGGIDYLFDYWCSLFSPAVRTLSYSDLVTASQQWSPALGAIVSGLTTGLMYSLGLIVTVAFTRKFFNRGAWFIFGMIVVAAAIHFSSERYWQDYLWNVTSYACLGMTIYFFITRLARKNPLAYLFAGFSAVLETSAWGLSRSAWSLYWVQVVIILLVLVSPVLYTMWMFLPGWLLRSQVPEAAVVPVSAQSDTEG